MAGVIPDNYVNTEMVDNYCFDSCEFQYNYQPLDNFTLTQNKSKYQIQVSNPNNYKCKFSGEKYKLTDIYIILNSEDMRHRYERYETGKIIGEFIMSHKNDNNTQTLNICMAIKDVNYDANNGDIMTPLTETLTSNVGLKLNKFIMSKPYNYYSSENSVNTGGDTNTHWIVFDYNQFVMLINLKCIRFNYWQCYYRTTQRTFYNQFSSISRKRTTIYGKIKTSKLH